MQKVGFIKVKGRRVKYLRNGQWNLAPMSGGFTISGVYVVLKRNSASCDLHGHNPQKPNGKALWIRKGVRTGIWGVNLEGMRQTDAILEIESLVKAELVSKTSPGFDALCELFIYYGADSSKATSYAELFAGQARSLPIYGLCVSLQEKMQTEGLLEVCAEIDGCKDDKEILDVLGVSSDERELCKRSEGRLVGLVKSLSELVFDLAAA